MAVAIEHTVGAYAPGEVSVLIQDRLAKPTSPKPAMVFLTGHTSLATQVYGVDILSIMAAIAERGVAVAAVDGGGPATWGNDLAIARIGDAVTWLRATYGVVGPVLASGYSMGGGDAMNWAARNPDDCAGFLGFAPASDFDSAAATGFAASLDAAYGGNYAVNGVGHNPVDLAQDLSARPWQAWYATDDTVLQPATIAALAASIPGSGLVGVTGNHVGFFANVPEVDVADWVEGILLA